MFYRIVASFYDRIFFIGAPIVLTLPHLYQASNEYIKHSAIGFDPQQELHETFVDLQPVSIIINY